MLLDIRVLNGHCISLAIWRIWGCCYYEDMEQNINIYIWRWVNF